MRLFEVDVEMALRHPTSRQMYAFERAMNIASGVFAANDECMFVFSFTVGADSYRDAVLDGLDRVAAGARAIAVSEEPVSFKVMERDEYFRRLKEQIDNEPSCPIDEDECPFYRPWRR